MSAGEIGVEIDTHHSAYTRQLLPKFSAIKEAREHSFGSLDKIRAAMRENPPSADFGVETLAVAGSLARLEASENSDLDLIMITDRDLIGTKQSANLCAWRDMICESLNLEKPNPKGVFAEPVFSTHLRQASGEAGEPYATTAKRSLLILESDWVFGETGYRSLLQGVIDQYAADVAIDPKKNFVFLLNDIVRYFRALCVNYQFTKSETEYGKWPIRNVKLRHSRVLMYFSMIAALGSMSEYETPDKIKWLSALIELPPLERLYVVYALSGDDGFDKLAEYYDRFLGSLAERGVRDELEGLSYESRYDSSHFATLKRNSDALSEEILRFYEARRSQWDKRFFEYMVI